MEPSSKKTKVDVTWMPKLASKPEHKRSGESFFTYDEICEEEVDDMDCGYNDCTMLVDIKYKGHVVLKQGQSVKHILWTPSCGNAEFQLDDGKVIVCHIVEHLSVEGWMTD